MEWNVKQKLGLMGDLNMTRMEKFLEQYPRAAVMRYKDSKSLCIMPCAIDETLKGDMTRRSCAWAKRYMDCNECCVRFWSEEIE